MLSQSAIDSEKAKVKQAIEDCIQWPFPRKNIDRLLGAVAQDSSFFIFHPDSKSTVTCFSDFRKMIDDIFLSDDCRPTNTEIKNLRIQLSTRGDVAWFACLLDDFGEFKGQAWAWVNARWTGVLEKRNGRWLITQMHFSLPTDREETATD